MHVLIHNVCKYQESVLWRLLYMDSKQEMKCHDGICLRAALYLIYWQQVFELIYDFQESLRRKHREANTRFVDYVWIWDSDDRSHCEYSSNKYVLSRVPTQYKTRNTGRVFDSMHVLHDWVGTRYTLSNDHLVWAQVGWMWTWSSRCRLVASIIQNSNYELKTLDQ